MLGALLATLLLQGQGPEVMVAVDRDRVAPGDVILYTIRVSSHLPDPIRIEVPSLGGFELEARAERSEVNADGDGGRTTTLELRLRATQPGEWRLGPVQVRQGAAYARGESVLVTIEGGPPPPVTATLSARLARLLQRAPPPGVLGPAAITVMVSDSVVVVGQQLDVVTIAWFERELRQQLRRAPTVEAPQVEGVWSYPQSVPGGIAGSRQVGGKWYDLFVLHQVAFPLTPGRITVAPARLQYSVPLAFQFFSQEERYKLSSPAVAIEVRPLPDAGRDPRFAGAVGREIRLTQSVTPGHTRQGEAVSAEITVTGEGNVALWPQPEIRWPAGVRVYPEASRERVALRDGRLGGSKTFRYLLVADSAGAVSAPVLRYPYFDPVSGRYEIATSAGPALVVAPRGNRVSSRAEPPPMRLDRRRPVALRLQQALPDSGWLAVALAFPLGYWASRRRRRRAPPPPVVASPGPADSLARIEQRLQQALARLAPGLADSADAELTASLVRSGLEPESAGRITRLRATVRQARYGSGATPATSALAQELEDLLARLTPRGKDARRRWRERAGVITMLAAACLPALGAQTPPEKLYEAAAYSAAAEGFARRALAEPGITTHWFNLGNAAWRAGDDAQSLAAWIRAARLSPRDQGVRRALLLVPPADQWASRSLWISPVTPPELWLLGLIAWITGWTGAALTRSLQGRWLVLLGGALLLAGAGTALARWYRRPIAVLAANQVLRLSPHEQAPPAGEVARLGTVRLGERRGAWVRVVAAGDQEGWILAQTLRPAGDLLPP